MSVYYVSYEVGRRVLWNPSNGAGDLFFRTGEMLGGVEGAPTGVGPNTSDEHHVDLDAFCAFVDALVARFTSSRHTVIRALLEGYTATALVMVERAGRTLPSLSEPPPPSNSDVPIGVGGMSPPGDARRLRDLSEQLDLAMPY